MRRRSASIALGIGVLSGLAVVIGARDAFTCRTGFYGPRTTLRYAKPTLRWEIWSENGQVTSSEMTVDGTAVDAKYEALTHSLKFTPLLPLSPGVHKVHCRVTFSNTYTFNRDWEAPVDQAAVAELPAPLPGQEAAFETANELRSELGLPPFVMDPRLNDAAKSHADYLAKNNVRGHAENPGGPGFLGVDPANRLETLGWGGSSWEDLAYVFSSDQEAVHLIFDAPYHRVPFMQPGSLQFGFGSANEKAVAEFEATHEAGVVKSPADGQQGVPLSWSSQEKPDPLDVHPGNKQPVGYPIVVADFTPGKATVQVESAHLYTESGAEVPTLLNAPNNDSHLTNAFILIPVSPLKPGAQYKVEVKAMGVADEAISSSWMFRCAAKK